MIKKLLILASLLFAVFISIDAQEMSVKSFEYLPKDLTARTSPRNDRNGTPCAVIRVGIALQGVVFDGNTIGAPVYNTGEYLVYMPGGSRQITLRHDSYLPLTVVFADYGIDKVESSNTYRLTVPTGTTPSPQRKGNFLIMNVTPTSSQVTIDDGVSTATESDGSFKVFLNNGTHSYRVEAGNAYSPVSGTVEMKGERITLPITLQSVKASLSVKATTSGSKIYVNEDYKGIDQWQGSLSPGTYLVEVKKDGYRPYSTTVSLAKQQSESLIIPALQASYGTLLVDYKPIDAEVYLDNNLLGKVPNVFDNILAGKHTIKISKDGYSDYTGSVTIQENQQASVSGSLTKNSVVSSSPSSTSGTLVPITEGSRGQVPLTHQQNNDQAIIVPEIEEFTVNGVTFRMIRVDGGSFTMGATKEQGTWSPDTDEYPTHKVKLGNFMIGETEVTQALWTAVMGSNPSHFHGANKPVEKVSWNDCQLFIEKLNKLTGKCFRLPTEAEWEYAARGGKHSCGFRYPGSNKPKETCWYAGTNETKEVAKKCPNEIGIYDMGGNVWEWCNDWKGNYSSSDETNPIGPRTGVKKVLRGGSINSTKDLMRITHRSSNTPDYSKSYIGMRLAL